MIIHKHNTYGTAFMQPMQRLFRQLIPLLCCALAILSPHTSIFAQQGSDTETQSQTPLDRFLANPAVNAATTSVYIAQIGSRKVLAEHNAQLPLLGASTMKLVTTASLLRCRDISHRYKTRVETAGQIKNRILEGNLHIIASGDPTLNSDRTPASSDFINEIVSELKRRNIDTIRGRILIDQSLYEGEAWPESWSNADKARDYGTGAHAFNFHRNHSGSNSVADPSAIFLSALEREMAHKGIVLEKRNFTGGGRREILTHVSAPLDEIMRSCMMRSDNLYAECLLREIPIAKGLKGSIANGLGCINEIWSRDKAPMQGVRILDGCGLSRSDRLTAQFLAHVLRAESMDPYFASFFPLAGADGTLRSFLKGSRLETYIALKTGSLHDVQAYAGYRLNDNYEPTHVVVIIANDFHVSRSALRKAVEQLLLDLL